MNILRPFSRIGRRLREEAAKEGLEMKEFLVRPDLDDENATPHAQAVFVLHNGELPAVAEEDPEFEAFLAGQVEAERQQKEEAAKEGLADLSRRLQEGGGIL